MLKKTFIFIFYFSIFTLQAQVKADDILGNWTTVENSVSVKVYKLNNEYRAKVTWFDERLGSGKPMNLRHDTQNVDPELRKRKVIGMEILEGLTFNPETSSWENGTIYDGSSGKYWDSSVTLNKDGTLKVRGYWKVKWIGKSLIFRRVNPGTFKKL
ncbi:DUF2147 domain-containing protein [Kaistella sp. G5-32]|uniref:DUF2147 domain-containing protein n=1 Tax=Kaistella gelatinilytica TaxID=2787636 RepID=A0ABS0F920_9FLAO|nr:DUF2147 domain-containing protein [Kaistella gelatinilytica]MBF8456206.1 DUF2147 domain-containing protein [Kaistella gelatinilytica]